MQTTTLIISIIGSLFVLILRPAQSFAVYTAVLLWYPTYLAVEIGSLNFTAGRIVAIVLLMRCLFTPQLRRNFIINWLDKWIIIGCTIAIIIPLIAWQGPMLRVFQNKSGLMVDTFFAYLIARFCINNRPALITTIKWIGVILGSLALLGVVESVSGWQPYRAFQQYCPWDPKEAKDDRRFGLHRAIGPFGHYIMFGAAFVLFLPFIYWLRHERGYWRGIAYLLSVLTIFGALSSMSSGPVMMLVFTSCFLVLERFKRHIKSIIILVAIMCVLVQVISNRPLYHVIVSYANPLGGEGWYRAKMIDLAIEHFGDWWLVGYGGQDPGWGQQFDSSWTDITNEYIGRGVQYGISGVIALFGVLITGIYMLVSLYKSEKSPELKALYWAMGSVLIMLIISFNSCTFFSQTTPLFYCILGIIGSSPNFAVSAMNRLNYS